MYLSIRCTYQFKCSSRGTPSTLALHSYNHAVMSIAECIAICYGLALASVSCVVGVFASSSRDQLSVGIFIILHLPSTASV
jgi:hypothetical protein